MLPAAHPADLSVCHFALSAWLSVCLLAVRLSVCLSVPQSVLSASCLPARRLCFSCQTNFVARLAGVVLICCSFALPAAPTLPPSLPPLALGLSSLAQFEQILIYGYKAANGNGNLRRLLPRRLA